jgi:hypothetical protein
MSKIRKTWGEELEYQQQLINGKRSPTIDDVEWLLIRLEIETKKFHYYLGLYYKYEGEKLCA